MLHLFVKGLGRNRSDPLYDANLAVTGGKDAEPLKVTGTCLSPKAGAEIAQLVREVYPSANKVDVSGLKVMTATAAEEPVQVAVRTGPKWKKSRRLKSSGDQIYVNLSKKTYTVQPGDSIFVIARKYGHRGADWYALWEANRKTIKNPHVLTVGTVLKLPPGWHMSNKTDDSNP
jgi:nucleoid-associated protein YgaU